MRGEDEERDKHQWDNVGVTVVTVTRAGKTTATRLNPTNLQLNFFPFILLFLLTLKLRGEMKKRLQESGNLNSISGHKHAAVSHMFACAALACNASTLACR